MEKAKSAVQQADEWAAEFGRKPRYDAGTLAMYGAIWAGGSVMVFGALIGVSPDDHLGAFGAVIALGAALPALWHWNRMRGYWRAWHQGYAAAVERQAKEPAGRDDAAG